VASADAVPRYAGDRHREKRPVRCQQICFALLLEKTEDGPVVRQNSDAALGGGTALSKRRCGVGAFADCGEEVQLDGSLKRRGSLEPFQRFEDPQR